VAETKKKILIHEKKKMLKQIMETKEKYYGLFKNILFINTFFAHSCA